MGVEKHGSAVAEAPAKVRELPGSTSRTYKFIKRAFDIVASVLMTAICLVPMAVIVVMIMEGPG